MKTLSREAILRMTDYSGGSSTSVAGGISSGMLAAYATKEWVAENFLTVGFFDSIFQLYNNQTKIDPNGELPTDRSGLNIKAMFGFWTDFYISALGNGGQASSAIYLSGLADVDVTGVQNGQALVWNSTLAKWVPGTGGGGADMNTVWAALAAGTSEQINASHLATALSGYLPLTGGSLTGALSVGSSLSVTGATTMTGAVTMSSTLAVDGNITMGAKLVATQEWTDNNYVSIGYFSRLFHAYNGNTAVNPNDLTTTIDNIKAMFGFWTDFYISALGNGGQASSAIYLSGLADVDVTGVQNGQALVWNSTLAKWVPGTGGGGADMNTVWAALAAATSEQINASHLATALSGYLPLTGGTMTGNIGIGGDSAKFLISSGSSGANSPLRGIKLPLTYSNWIGLFARPSESIDEGGLLLSEDTCVVYNSFDAGFGFLVVDTDLSQSDWSSTNAQVFGINDNHQAWSLGGFVKYGADDNCVLLGGGGHALISGLSVAYATSAGSATKLQTSISLWGNLFDGTADVNGNITTNGNLSVTGATTMTGAVTMGSTLAVDGNITMGTKLVATQEWTNNNYVSIGYFSRLFHAYNGNTAVNPNDLTTTIDNIKAMFGFWTDFYISALGNGGQASSAIYLSGLADVDVTGVQNGQALVWNSTLAKWVPGTGGGGAYLPLAGGAMFNTNLVTNMNADMVDGVHLNGLFREIDNTRNINFGDVNNKNGVIYIHRDIDGGATTGFWADYGSVLNISYDAASWQLGVSSAGDFKFRSQWWSGGSGVWSDWKDIALLTSNVASATKLQTAQSLWGQSFDGTAGVNGIMTFSTLAMSTDYTDTWTDGNSNAHPWYGYDHRYPNTGVFSTTIADYYGLTLKTGSGNISMTTGGFVGIGTTNPLYKLHVDGQVYSSSGFLKSGSDDTYVLLGGGGHSLISGLSVAYATSAGSATTATSATNANYATSAGSATTAGSASRLTGDTSYTAWGQLFWSWGIPNNVSGNIYLYGDALVLYGSSTAYLSAYSSGNKIGVAVGGTSYFEFNTSQFYSTLGIYTTSYVTALSDMRKKNVIDHFALSLHDVANAPIFHYQWKEGDDDVHVGSSAQYWQVLLPDAVPEVKGFLSMDYGKIGLLSAISLARVTVNHEQRIAQLENEIRRLKSLIK